jgi:hypothetical protein
MKKYTFSMLSALCMGACASLYADNYTDFQNYKPGESLAWFYDLRTKSLVKSNSKEVEAKLLSIIDSKEISNAAFDRACEILKPIATSKSIDVLAKYIGDDFRTSWVCSVLITIDDDDVDEILIKKLPSLNAKTAKDVISTLAARGDDDSIEVIAKYANSEDKSLAEFSVYALGKFLDDDAIEVLAGIAKKGDFRQQASFEALSAIANNAIRAGKKSLAIEALEAVPEDFAQSISTRALLAKNKVKYLDSWIIQGKNVAEAGRLIYKDRKFEDSEAIIEAFPNLSKEGQLAAISTFMLSGDTRFYPVIEPLINSKDFIVRLEAIYAARFLCSDEAVFKKIYPLMSNGHRILKMQARRVFEENPSFAVVKVLKEKEAQGDLLALEILVNRGDVDARAKIWKLFLEGGYDKTEVYQAFENSIVTGELRALAQNLKSDNQKLKNAIARVIIRKIAKTRDKLYMGGAAYEVFNGIIDEKDPIWKLVQSKLKTKIAKRKNVWQAEFRLRAVEDDKMKVAEGAEPNLDRGFVDLFDGKTLNGWKTSTGSAKYSVVDGCIQGVLDRKMKQNSFLITERNDYKDFIFTCDFKWEEFGNSGIIFKGYFNEDGKVVGPQAEMCDNRVRRWTGGIYHEGKEWKYSLSRQDQEDARNAVDLDSWNRMTIKVEGDRMQTWVNGVPVADLVWKDVNPGFIGLQVHMGKTGKILWKNIKIKELK